MESIFLVSFVWFTLAVLAAVVSFHVKISSALVEICIGTVFAYCAGCFGFLDHLAINSDWLKFVASSGAVLLTFLAGTELEPKVLRRKISEVSVVGIIGFFAPFLGCAAVAKFLLNWDSQASLLCGVALSTTSMAVVYAVMLETGLNKTDYGKGILGSCFINDLGTVIALGLIFSPFTFKTVIFVSITALVMILLPSVSRWMTLVYGNRTAAIRTKWAVMILFGLSALALWSGSEAVLPAYIMGIVLASFSAEDAFWLRRFRTLTVGFFTPIYFLRAGTFVSLPAILSAPKVFIFLFLGKVLSKIVGLFPVISIYRKEKSERCYYTLLMSTGLTFGTISALYGLSNKIITQEQYSFLVAVVIASAVIPTMIAEYFFQPLHLFPKHTEAPTNKIG
ncbi:MAG: cation:proton antiporter [Candidatus Riflebacteria bacterium]|nr:cation:proton antiporter [Candidatus Riflebacteria bacterium]